MCYIYHGEGFFYHGEVSFLSNTDLTDLTDWTDFTVRGDCALMRPIGLGEYVTGICSRRVLAFPSDRLTHILPRQDIIRVQSSRMTHTSSDNY